MNPRERLSAVEAELRSIHEAAGDADLTTEQQTQFDTLVSERSTLQAGIQRDEARRSVVAELGQRSSERGDGPAVHVKEDPFAVLSRATYGRADKQLRNELVSAALRANENLIEDTENQKTFERHLRRHAGDTAWAANIVARSKPEYTEAFSKLMTGREQFLTTEERAAIAVGTNTAGGFLLPTHLDPSIILTNGGASNNIRQISRVVTLTDGNVWNGISSAGVTASWDAELAEVSDDSPALAKNAIPIYKAASFVQASIEAFEDLTGLATDVLMMFADAKDRLEGAAFSIGTGSGQPTGIFTALDANTNVELITTTANTVGLTDLWRTYTALQVRWRSRATWLMNPLYLGNIQQLGATQGAAYSTDITQAPTTTLLGHRVVVSDDAPAVQTTTSNDNVTVFGDFNNYVIVDKPGSMSVEFIPHLFNTANNLPDGRRGWYAHWRTGADSVNDLAFRLLLDKTSA